MKIFKKIIIISSLFGLILFYGCSEDEVIEEVAASIDISLSAKTSDGTTLVDGGNVTAADSFQIVISITAEAGFNTLNISGDIASSAINRNDLELASGTTDAELTLTVSTSNSLGDGSIDFEAVDEEGNTATASFSFVVVSPAAKIQTAVMLYAPLGDSSSQTFLFYWPIIKLIAWVMSYRLPIPYQQVSTLVTITDLVTMPHWPRLLNILSMTYLHGDHKMQRL